MAKLRKSCVFPGTYGHKRSDNVDDDELSPPRRDNAKRNYSQMTNSLDDAYDDDTTDTTTASATTPTYEDIMPVTTPTNLTLINLNHIQRTAVALEHSISTDEVARAGIYETLKWAQSEYDAISLQITRKTERLQCLQQVYSVCLNIDDPF